LKRVGRRLAEAAERNAAALKAAAAATENLIRSIVDIVKKEVLAPQGYTNPRNTSLALGAYSPTCRPVAVNRTA
jgi:hypothetical protein